MFIIDLSSFFSAHIERENTLRGIWGEQAVSQGTAIEGIVILKLYIKKVSDLFSIICWVKFIWRIKKMNRLFLGLQVDDYNDKEFKILTFELSDVIFLSQYSHIVLEYLEREYLVIIVTLSQYNSLIRERHPY